MNLPLPTRTGSPSTRALAPCPSTLANSAAGGKAIPCARCMIALASGCSEFAFKGSRGGKQVIRGNTLRSDHVHHLRCAERQGSGLVEDHGVELVRILQGLGVLDKNAVAGPEPGADHDGHRRRQSQGIRTGNDEDGNHQGDREDQRRTDDAIPHEEGEEPYRERCEHQPLRGAVGQHLRRGLRILRFLDELHDLGECGVGADLGCPIAQQAALVDGGADNLVAGLLGDGERLPVNIDSSTGKTFGDNSVDRDFAAWPHYDNVVQHDVGGGHFGLDTVP